MKNKSAVLLSIFGIALLFACSTENNSLLNRTYHSTTARYNGHFNATELMRISMKTYTDSRKEDFYNVLPVNPLPNETEVKGMYPAIDTAVVKCTKVIVNHSMPSAENMAMKSAEYNTWIDENWLTVGKAYYLRRDYEKAMKNFLFVKRFFTKDPSMFEAELWIAKINIELNKFADAKLALDDLNEISQAQKKRKFTDFIPFYKPKSDPAEESESELPRMKKSLQFDIYKAYADLAVRRKDYPAAAEGLNLAISKCKTPKEKARLHFILGQVYNQNRNVDSASIHFNLANKSAASFEIAFNARINRAMVGSSDNLGRDLKKMLRDAKNAPFKDQIFFALANYELNRSDKPKAIEYLTKSAFFSTTNKRQKAMSYEKLGDLTFADKDYVSAQKYYDSCSRFIDDNYPNGELVKNRAIKLFDLVKAIEVAIFEDSVQRIARLSEKDRTEFLKDALKQIKEEQQKRKEQEAAKMLALQDQANSNVGGSNANKFVFNNPKLREAGFNEFKKTWGVRENEDDWRRSDKVVNVLNKEDAVEKDSLNSPVSKSKDDTLSLASLLKDIPLTDDAMKASKERLMDALFTSGVLYKEILNEEELAEIQFKKVLAQKNIGLTDLSSAFQLYKINEATGEKERYKDHIIDYYPSSDAAKYFKDPDFYLKQKEFAKQAEKEYVALLDRYNAQDYRYVANQSQLVIDNDKSNAYRAEYMLLNVLAVGQTTENKNDLVPKLKAIMAEKPGTSQAIRAKEMLAILDKGFSTNEAVNFNKTYAYVYSTEGNQSVIVLLDEEDDSDDAKKLISDFSNKKFKTNRVKVSMKTSMSEKNFILVQDFENIKVAQDYIDAYKAGFEILDDLQDNKIYIISIENLKKLIETSKFDEYKLFYDDNY
jgi:ribosomal protein L21